MLDDISRKILGILQEKARIPNVEVARQVGMAPSAVLERIRKMEKQGVIDGYEVRLNPERFQCRQIAFITVIPDPDIPDSPGGGVPGNALADRLTDLPEVQEVHYISGTDGYLLKVRVADPEALWRLLQDRIRPLPGVRKTKTMTVLHSFKETARIPLEPDIPETASKIPGTSAITDAGQQHGDIDISICNN